MSEQDAAIVLRVLRSMTLEDVQALNTSKYSIISRLLRSWRDRKPLRKRLLEKQKNISALSPTRLLDNGKDTHVDHIWTIKDAVAAVENGERVGETYKKLWDENNLRLVTPEENYARNVKPKETQ